MQHRQADTDMQRKKQTQQQLTRQHDFDDEPLLVSRHHAELLPAVLTGIHDQDRPKLELKPSPGTGGTLHKSFANNRSSCAALAIGSSTLTPQTITQLTALHVWWRCNRCCLPAVHLCTAHPCVDSNEPMNAQRSCAHGSRECTFSRPAQAHMAKTAPLMHHLQMPTCIYSAAQHLTGVCLAQALLSSFHQPVIGKSAISSVRMHPKTYNKQQPW